MWGGGVVMCGGGYVRGDVWRWICGDRVDVVLSVVSIPV